MILVDTCIWIEFLKGKEPVFSQLRKFLETDNVLAFEGVFAELLQGVKNKREQDIAVGYWDNLPKTDAQGIWLQAGLESNRNNWLTQGVSLMDAAILVYARTNKCRLWTVDKKLMGIAEPDELFAP